jgi:hypothetical protein
MHPIDRVAAIMVRHGPGRLRIFPGGWGDPLHVAQLGDTGPLLGEAPGLEIEWGHTKHLADRAVRDGRFAALTDVPEPARVGRIRLITPAAGTDRLCLLIAAWNDHGFATREQLADHLLARGIASLIVEIPYYGTRRVVAADEQPIQTVADFARMGLGTVVEGRALLRYFRSRYQMGVSGYSMGGNISALIGASAGFPVAMAPLAASHSPGPVFLDGVISNGIQWDALGGKDQEPKLRAALSATSVLSLPAPPWAHAAVLVAARSDGFIPREATEELHRHWPGSELRWQRGGHATVLWQRRDVLAEAIADSFDRLAVTHSATSPAF